MEKILNILENQNDKSNVIVIGDSILEKYIYGDITEEKLTILKPKKMYYYLGGAANTAHNVHKLGGNSLFFTAFGEGDRAKIFHMLLKGKGLSNTMVVKDKYKEISLRTKLVCSTKPFIRIDEDDDREISEGVVNQFYNQLSYCVNVNKVKTMIISDKHKGCITKELYRCIKKLCCYKEVKLLIDCSKKSDFSDVYLLKHNLRDFERIIGTSCKDLEAVIEAALNYKKDNNIKNLLITMGKDGLLLIEESNRYIHMSSLSDDVIDASGAENAMIAAIAVCLANNIDLKAAVEFANHAVAACLRKPGIYAVGLSDIRHSKVEYLYEKNN